jgi:tetratricopeptide (TPR) repeat protein
LAAAIALAANVAFAQATPAAPSCDPAPARAASVQGTVEVKRVAQPQWQPVRLDDTFCPGDSIRVQERSRADIALLNQSVLRLNANSAITIEEPKEKKTGVVDLLRGVTHILSRGPNSLEVKTPYTLAGVRGTEFLIAVGADRTDITVFEGMVVAQNPAGSLSLTDGQSASAAAGQAPVTRTVARPRDAVQWALYYPPVVYLRPDEFPAGAGWQGSVRSSMDAYAKGDLTKALDNVLALPPDVGDPRVYSYRAHLLLAVGRVDEARSDIDRALKLAPNDANALALQAVIAVTQGEKGQALDTARKAVAASPNSATAHLALSYAQQASFDLPGARASAQTAVQADPQNALAWARMAELESSFGNFDATLAAAQKAVALDPGVSRTQAVLGFSYLMQVNTAQARAAFAKAIALDSADPLPRLGLGLARIRDGDLEGGGRDIEVAASLDPNNALVRSYLGKTYYEEKLEDRAGREFGVAKSLDPNDPTPWFYDAILKQTTNRPVEALRDMEKAIELNDNRAVYRSELLLDSDNAARSASLARIYTDLGFQELALVEGWKSVRTDPTNFSAHRFLADSYATLPRHQIARVSELLQSQLLQPVNLTPLQPRAAESNLFLISSQGPGTASFNEFNPLFTRDGFAAQLGAMVGEHDTLDGDVVLAGLRGKGMVSVGYSGFRTDGFRINNDQDDQIVSAFGQYDFSPQASIQAEYRYRKTEIGDLQQRFLPDSELAGLRNTQELNTFRLGGRYGFAPDSIVLASVQYQDAKFTTVYDEPGIYTALDIPQDALGIEAQYLYRSPKFNFRGGVGYFDVSGEINATNRFEFPPPPDGPGTIEDQSTTNTDIKHLNVYGYFDLRLLRDVTITLGASYDSLSGDVPGGEDKNRFNPKFGFVWNPLPSTTVRGAWFTTLKRTLVTNQTLEPTEIAGFNQFYDDGNLTEATVYGVAVDQKFGRDVFGGLEYGHRDLTVPYLDAFSDPLNPPQWREVDWQDSLGRAYLFWTPHPWWALRAEYMLERFERDDAFTAGVRNLDIQRVPLGVRFFHPSGFTAGVTATYWYQKGQFEQFTPAGSTFVPGSDKFWVVDAAIGYRLPKRYGFVTVGATNLFDTQFQSYDIDPANSTVQPKRMLFARLTIALP